MFSGLGVQNVFSQTNSLNLYSNSMYSNSVNNLYHGIDWIYVNIQALNIYEFKVWYFWFLNSVFDESFDYFFFYFWIISLIGSNFQLFSSYFLDLYIYSSLIKFPYFDEWFNNIFCSKEMSLIYIYHPELIFFKFNIFLNLYNNNFNEIYFNIYSLLDSEIFFNPVFLVIQLIAMIFFCFLFISFYFSYFNTSLKEDNQNDVDFLLNSLTVESEKEISSFDDMILAAIVLVYIFGWYFYIHCWSILSILPELVLVFYLLPALYYIIVGIPTFLMLDFGIFFLAYLKGVGGSKIFFVELMFDYISVVIFYTRILVQGIRLVLMIATYAGMHDVVLFFTFNQKMFLGYENISEDLNNVLISFDTFSYFFLFSLPSVFLHWVYEILHTFFVVTIQFAAFFAIVFWLFLFLYTFFVLEKQENYFTSKRKDRVSYFNYLNNLKKNIN